MAARDGMVTLISTLRGLAHAGTADYTLAGVSFWSDDEVQRVLDRHRHDFYREEMDSVPTHLDGGTIQYTEYRARRRHLEETQAGTAVFIVEQATGENVGTASWSADYERGVVTFTADQGGSARFLTGRSYDLNAAAADMWRMKLGHYADTHFDFATPTHKIQKSKLVAQAREMLEQFKAMEGVQTVEMVS